MPLNTYICRKCGKRNNYVVEMPLSDEPQIVQCSVCKEENAIDPDSVPERVRQTISDLDRDSNIFAFDGIRVSDDDVDLVEDTLAAMDDRFEEVVASATSLTPSVNINTNIVEIVEEYAPDGKSIDDSAKKMIDNIMHDEGRSERLKAKRRRIATDVLEKAESKVDSDSISGRMVSFLKEASLYQDPIAFIQDEDAMDDFGLKKSEKFLIRKALKNGRAIELLDRVI